MRERYISVEKNTIKRMRELEAYCIKYNEWPRDYRNKTSEKEKIARSLNVWLVSHHYHFGKNSFDYGDVILWDNSTTNIKLDELYLKYSNNINRSLVYAKQMMEETILYAKEYGEWPSAKPNVDLLKDSKSKKLYSWLVRNNYFSLNENFKWGNLVDENGSTYDFKLLCEHLKCKNIAVGSKAYIINKVNEVELYVNTYSEWPKEKGSNPKSRELYTWLSYSKYHFDTNDFLYNDVKDENGVFVKKRLDEIFIKYGHTNRRTDLYDQVLFEKVIEYTIKNRDLPKQRYKTRNDEEKYANKLHSWLNIANLFSSTEPFKYSNISYHGEDGYNVLLLYYAIFTWKKQKNIGNLNVLNLTQSKNSKNIGRVIYFYISEYLRGKVLNDNDLMLTSYIAITEIMKKEKINFAINKILCSFDKPLSETLLYLYEQYCKYSIANNNEMALMFKSLYEYCKFVGVLLNHNKNENIEKVKSLFK